MSNTTNTQVTRTAASADAISALLELIGEVRHRELVELRIRFNKPSQGGWGIVFDPNACRWTAIRGRQLTVFAGTAAELRDRIAFRTRHAWPRPEVSAPAA